MKILFALVLALISSAASAQAANYCYQQDRSTWLCSDGREMIYSDSYSCRESCERPRNSCSMWGRGWTCNDGNETFFYTEEECVSACR